MAEFRPFLMLLVNAVAGLLSVSGTGVTSKQVCQADSVQAFQNIDFDRCNGFISLNINGDRSVQIASWTFQNCTQHANVTDEYKDRVFLYQNGTIIIHNFHTFDQGKYIVMAKKDTFPSIQEVKLDVIVASSKGCKPLIKRVGNKLLANLEYDSCGRPIATVYWKGDDGVSETHDQLIEIAPGNEPRIYTACIEGPAVKCAKSLTQHDYCSSFEIEGKTQGKIWTASCSTDGLISGIIILGILLFIAVVVIVILIRKVRKDTMKLMYAMKLLNHDQQQDLQMYCSNAISPRNDHRQRSETRTAIDHTMSDVLLTEHQPGIDPEKIKELLELRDAALCKICFENKTNVFVMPCNHVATCADCSVSLDKCPVCRTTIVEKKIICF